VITFDEKIVALWFLQTMPTQDWLAAVREIKPDEEYELCYRFRYIKDDKIFDSEDRKSWYRGSVTGTRNYVLLSIRNVAKTLESVASGELYEVINTDGIQDFMRRFQDLPFVWARQLQPGETP
jgi:hypothetical protein